VAARGYVSPFPKLTDLVIAARALYSIQSASVPFFSMNTLAMAGGTDDATDQSGSAASARSAAFAKTASSATWPSPRTSKCAGRS